MIVSTSDEHMPYSQEIVEWDAGVIDVVNMMVCIFDYYTIGHVVANNLSSLKNQFERDL